MRQNHQIRLRVKFIMVRWVETIKSIFEWKPAWSYWLELLDSSSKEIHHGHMGQNHQTCLQVKSIMVTWLKNSQKWLLLVKMCSNELWNEFYWFSAGSEIPSNSSNNWRSFGGRKFPPKRQDFCRRVLECYHLPSVKNCLPAPAMVGLMTRWYRGF